MKPGPDGAAIFDSLLLHCKSVGFIKRFLIMGVANCASVHRVVNEYLPINRDV